MCPAFNLKSPQGGELLGSDTDDWNFKKVIFSLANLLRLGWGRGGTRVQTAHELILGVLKEKNRKWRLWYVLSFYKWQDLCETQKTHKQSKGINSVKDWKARKICAISSLATYNDGQKYRDNLLTNNSILYLNENTFFICSQPPAPPPPQNKMLQNISWVFICFQHWQTEKGRLPFKRRERTICTKGKKGW